MHQLVPTPKFERAFQRLVGINWFPWLLPLLNAVVACAIVIGTVNVLAGSVLGLLSFSDIWSLDSANLLRIRDVVHSDFFYPEFDHPPFLVTIYGPLTYLLLAVPYSISEMVGLNPQALVRFAVFGTFLSCLILAFRVSRRVYFTAPAALTGVLFFVSTSTLKTWTTQIRSDFLALTFALAGLCIVLQSERRRWLIVAALSAGLGLLTKQTFVALPGAVFLWLLCYKRDVQKAFLWIAAVAIVVAGGMMATWLREPLLFRHLSALSSPITDFRSGIELIGRALARPMLPLAVLGGFLALFRGTAESALLALYALTSWLIAFLTIPQIGGNVNYFWEPLLVSALLAGIGWRSLSGGIGQLAGWARVLLAAIVIGLCLPRTAVDLRSLRTSFKAASTLGERNARWASFSAELSGRRLLSTISAITALAKIPEVPDPFLNSALELGGKWSFAPIVFDVETWRFELICVRRGDIDGTYTFRGLSMWSERLREAVRKHYVHSCDIDGIEVWLPGRGSGDLKSRLLSAGCSEPNPTGGSIPHG